jgi:LysM repeat protein
LPVLKTDIEIHVPYNVNPGQLPAVASKFGISVQHILGLSENSDRGLTGKEKVMEVYYIPYRTQPTDTLTIVASKFGISPQHLAEFVPSS